MLLQELAVASGVGRRLDDSGFVVPVKIDDYHYYSRTEKGKQFPILCRKRRNLDADEEVMLGPGAAESLDDLRTLLDEALRIPGPRRLRLWLTASQHELLRCVFDAGFAISSISTYMVKGEWEPPPGPHFMAMFPEAI